MTATEIGRAPAPGFVLASDEGEVLAGEPLSRHTTWRIGGPARWFCRVRSEAGLGKVLAAASAAGEPVALLGMGSNVLAADEGFPGYVVRLDGEFKAIVVSPEDAFEIEGLAVGLIRNNMLM